MKTKEKYVMRLKSYLSERAPAFASSLLVSFFVIFGLACLISYTVYKHAVSDTIRSNELRTDLMSKIVLEHQKAVIGILQSYGTRRLLANSVKEKDFKETVRHLTDLVKNNPEIERAFVADTGGTMLVDYPPFETVLNRNFSFQDWYKGVSREWKPYVSSAYKRVIGGEDIAVVVCVPIVDGREKAVGILGASQTAEVFQKIVLSLNAEIILIDKERHIIYSNRSFDRLNLVEYPAFEFVDRVMKGEEGNTEIRDSTDADQMKYISFAPIKGMGWSIIVEKTRSEVLQSILVEVVLIALISSLILVVVVLFLIYLRTKNYQMAALKNQTIKLRESENQLRLLTSQLLTAQETERKRISMELHDGFGQALIALKLHLASLQRKFNKDQKAIFDEYEVAQKDIERIIENIRRLSRNLSPYILENLGLSAALRWLVEDLTKNNKIEASIDIPNINNFLPERSQIIIYRIFQEALTNIQKHAQATYLSAVIRQQDDIISFLIEDNGRGFDVEQVMMKRPGEKGLGLATLEERARMLGVELEIRSKPGRGTTLSFAVPVTSGRT